MSSVGGGPSFEDAFRAEYPGIVRVVTPIVGSVADAEAVTQDAFVKAFTRWRRIGGYDRPGAWVQRVAVRDAVLPADAVDSGFRRHSTVLWHLPDDPRAIWLANLDGIKRWPQGEAPLCE